MTPLELIEEWDEGCSVSHGVGGGPEVCMVCTVGLITALRRVLTTMTKPDDSPVVAQGMNILDQAHALGNSDV